VTRYYFNAVTQGTVITDPEGVDIQGDFLEEVITATLEELRSDEPELFVWGGGWSIEVFDELGRMVAKFPV
jgi:hypothetical protein